MAALGAVSQVAAQTPQQLTERAREERPEEDVSAWTLTGGGVLNTGNTESWAVNTGTNIQLVRGRHAFHAESALIMSRAAVADTGYVTNARNANSRARYDFFFTPMDAAYYSVRHRWDTFAGLDTRLQNQVGYLRNFVRTENHRFWSEVGYDLTYDNLHPDPLIDPDTLEILPGTELVHAARFFIGYENALNEHVAFATGIEALLNFQQIEDLRLQYDARLRSTLAEKLQLELRFRLQFDNVPVPGAEKLDTATTVNLILSLV